MLLSSLSRGSGHLSLHPEPGVLLASLAATLPGCLGRRVQLNGRLLQMVDEETLPTLHEAALAPGSALGLPAFSYGFYVIRKAKAIACI